MYMEDLLFSTDTLDKARLMASESVRLLASRGFKLVKWTACRKAVPVITEMDEAVLAPSIRTLDLKT